MIEYSFQESLQSTFLNNNKSSSKTTVKTEEIKSAALIRPGQIKIYSTGSGDSVVPGDSIPHIGTTAEKTLSLSPSCLTSESRGAP